MVVAFMTLSLIWPIREAVVELVSQSVFCRLGDLSATCVSPLEHYIPTLFPLAISQQALVKHGFDALDIQLLANEDEFLAAVTHISASLHIMLDHGVDVRAPSLPLALVNDAEPRSTSRQRQHTSGLGPLASAVRTSRQPDLSFRSEESAEKRMSALVGQNFLIAGQFRRFTHVDIATVSVRMAAVAAIVIFVHRIVVVMILVLATSVTVVLLMLQNELVVQQIEQAAWVEWAATNIDEVANIVPSIVSMSDSNVTPK